MAKLTHNCFGYIATAAAAEVFSMGVKAGIEPLAIWEAVRKGAIGRRGAFDSLTDQFLPNKYEPPAFALRHIMRSGAWMADRFRDRRRVT